MIWIRVVFLVTPVLLLLLVAESVRSVKREVAARPPNRIVLGVAKAPGRFNPFVEGSELTERIEDFLFERLVEHGEGGEILPGLASSWSMSSSIRFFFVSERQAQEALVKITAAQASWEQWGVAGLEAVGDEVRISFKSPDSSGADAVHALLDADTVLPIRLLRVNVLQSSWDSYLDFKRNAVEAGQVRREWPTGVSSYELAVAGNTENFLREFKNYYDSNENLGASYRFEEEVHYLETPEMLVKLREDVFWHDGEPFTAADVTFSFNLSRVQEWNARLRGILGTVHSVAAADANTVRVLFREIPPFFLEEWALVPMLPRHILEGRSDAWWGEHFEIHPLGTGPLRVEGGDGNGGLVLKRHERYHLGLPETEEFVFRVAPDNARRRLRFLAGEIDSYVLQRGEEQFISREDARFDFLPTTPGTQVFLAWNGRREPFDQKRMRGALAREIDVEAMIEKICPGRGTVLGGLFPQGSPYAREGGADSLERSGGEAGRILEGLGWERVGGIWHDASEIEFTIRLASGDDEASLAAAEGVAAAWEVLGAKVIVMELPGGMMDDPEALFRDVDADAFVVSFPAAEEWHSFREGRGWNLVARAASLFEYGGGRAAELAGMLELERDEEKRLAQFREFEGILVEEEGLRGFFSKRDYRVVRKEQFAISRAIGDGHRQTEELDSGGMASDPDLPWWTRQ